MTILCNTIFFLQETFTRKIPAESSSPITSAHHALKHHAKVPWKKLEWLVSFLKESNKRLCSERQTWFLRIRRHLKHLNFSCTVLDLIHTKFLATLFENKVLTHILMLCVLSFSYFILNYMIFNLLYENLKFTIFLQVLNIKSTRVKELSWYCKQIV